MTNARRYVLAGAAFGLLFPILATILRVLNLGLPWSISNMLTVQATDPILWIIDTAPFVLSFFALIAGCRQDALEMANSLLRMRERQLETAQLVLEERVQERTRDLTSKNQQVMERAEQLRSVANTNRSLLSNQELDRLLPLAAESIGQNFGYEHVGVYLLDEQKQQAALMATNDPGNMSYPQQGQHLRISEQGLVEAAIRSGQAQTVSGRNPDASLAQESTLPHSQLVLPIKSGETVIGALDLQTSIGRAFSEEYVSILSLLADLVAIAVQNAMLHEKTQRTLREVEVSSGAASARVWSGWVESIRSRGYRYDGIRAEPLKEVEVATPQNSIRSIPIRLRGRTIGNLKVKLAESSQGWTDDDHAIAEATADRAALALEGARLLEEAKRRAAREAFLSDMAAKLSTSFQLDSILRDTVAELGQTLEGSTVSFQLINPSNPPRNDPVPPSETPRNGKNSE